MLMSFSFILSSSLIGFPSPLAGSSSQCAGPVDPFGAQPHLLASFEQTHSDLQRSVEALRLNPHQIELRDQVRLELEHLRHFPDRVASDPSVDALFTEAMLVVAASVKDCDPKFAQAWVDRALARQAIATSPSPRPDLTGLPAEFVTLYDERALSLSTADPATIRLQCEIACAVFVDGHQVPVEIGKVAAYPVIPGAHDVWVFHVPDGADLGASTPTRVSVTEIELGSGDQNCLSFPNPSYVGLLPSREEWWAAWSFARRIDWAIESKKAVVDIEPAMFEALVDESPVHALVLAQDPELRELRVRVALHLVDLWQQASQPDAAITILDRALLWADLLDSPAALTAAVGKFPGLAELFEARVAVRSSKPRGTIEIDCGRCLAVIDGVVVDADSFELPADSYRVEAYPSSASGDPIVFDDEVIVRANESTRFPERSPYEPPPVVPKPVVFEEEYRENPLLRRWVWGTAGAVALAGGGVWSLALADWRARKITDEQDPNKRTAKAIEFGLFVTGALFLHAEIAAYSFSRMPPSRRPGAPLLGVGAGLLGAGIVIGGHAVREWRVADVADDQNRKDAAVWVGSVATGVSLLSGAILVAIGAERDKMARHNGIVLPARVPPYQRPGFVQIVLGSGLLIAGSGFIGLGIPAALIGEDGQASAFVGLIGGGILAYSGVVLVVDGATRKRSRKSRTAIVPSFSPNALGLQIVGQF